MGFFSSLLGNDAAKAANQAAADTYNKQVAAANDYRVYGDTLPGAYNALAAGYDTYTTAGTAALSRLMAGLGLSGSPTDQADFTKAYQSLPGYQSGLATGEQAAQRGLNAGGGGLDSGKALKALYRYGSDYENGRLGDYFGRLGGLASTGLSATGAQTGLEAQGLGAQQNVRQGVFQGMYGAAPTIGQGLVAGANAQQQGVGNIAKLAAYLGGAALSGGLSGRLGSAAGSFGNYGGVTYPIFGSASSSNKWFA